MRRHARVEMSGEEYEEAYPKVIRELLAVGEHKFFVAVNPYGRYLGHVWVCIRVDTVDFLRTAYILDVETKFRGIGIGSALLEKAEEWAKSKGARKVSLRVELDNPAVGWYRKKGYRERALIMEKFIA